MERISVFSSPLFLGFDHFERLIDSLSKAQGDAYPPYNIEQLGEDGFRVTLALAGFHRNNISISLEDNQLTIRGKQQEENKNHIYIYRGIATRQFTKTFVLADGVEVQGASFDNGLLHINLLKLRNYAKVKHIEISSTNDSTPSSKTIENKCDITS